MRLWLLVGLLAAVSLACATNTPVARIATPRATRTPLPTFTNTPIPPSATPVPTNTDIPTPTNTPQSTPTPLPTDTPAPPTDTPAPTPTPVPPTSAPPPPPPTAPPAPDTPTPAPPPTPVSPVGTPTPTAIAGSPPGKYKPRRVEEQANCAHLGITGIVRDSDDDDGAPIPGVTIQVVGDEDGFRGPYYITTGSDGKYGMVMAEFGQIPDRVEFEAEIFGPGVDTDDQPQWQFSNDCHSDNALQVLRIDWSKVE